MARGIPEQLSYGEAISLANDQLHRRNFGAARNSYQNAADKAESLAYRGAAHYGIGLTYLCEAISGNDLFWVGRNSYLSLAPEPAQEAIGCYGRAYAEGDSDAAGQLVRCRVLAGQIAFARAIDGEAAKGVYETDEVDRARRLFGEAAKTEKSVAQAEAAGGLALLLALYGSDQDERLAALQAAESLNDNSYDDIPSQLVPGLTKFRRTTVKSQVRKRADCAARIMETLPVFDPDRAFDLDSKRLEGRQMALNAL